MRTLKSINFWIYLVSMQQYLQLPIHAISHLHQPWIISYELSKTLLHAYYILILSIMLSCNITTRNYWQTRIVRIKVRDELSFFDMQFTFNRIRNEKQLKIILALFLKIKRLIDVNVIRCSRLRLWVGF